MQMVRTKNKGESGPTLGLAPGVRDESASIYVLINRVGLKGS